MAKETKHKYYSCFCLTSQVSEGLIVSVSVFKKASVRKADKLILLLNSLEKLQKLFSSTKKLPLAIVTNSGSFADHIISHLIYKGVQIAIIPEKIKVPINRYAIINGTDQKIAFFKKITPNIRIKESSNFQNKSNLAVEVVSKEFSVFVDGNNSSDLKRGIINGATGIGILRTEWLGWNSEHVPTINLYKKEFLNATKAIKDIPFSIRLLDIGGSKLPAWAKKFKTHLESPLGKRGIRFGEVCMTPFSNQLSALNQIKNKDITIVVPMVSDVNDIHFAKNLIKGAMDEKKSHYGFRFGAMLETPSSILDLNRILPFVDSFRIGPGDLTQFTLAKLRSQINPIDFSGNGFHDSVMELIKESAKKCNEYKKPVSICLDVEPRTKMLEKLLSFGLKVFCVGPSMVNLTFSRLNDIFGVELIRR